MSSERHMAAMRRWRRSLDEIEAQMIENRRDRNRPPCRHCGEPKRLHGAVRSWEADNPPPLCLGYERKPLVEGAL